MLSATVRVMASPRPEPISQLPSTLPNRVVAQVPDQHRQVNLLGPHSAVDVADDAQVDVLFLRDRDQVLEHFADHLLLLGALPPTVVAMLALFLL